MTIPTARTLALAAAILCAAAAPGFANSYVAERFDARAAVAPDGALEVTETVVFRFESGTFKEAFRQIPRRRTDGIEILEASMDGVPMPFGTGPGQVEVRRRSGVRVVWRFPAPVSQSTHTFTLTYRVHGAVRRSDDGDLLSWRMLPSEHNYAIQEGTFEFELPARLTAAPALDSRRVARAGARREDGRVIVSLAEVRRNGWADVRLLFETGAVIDAPPAWQLAVQRADALGPRWLGAGGIVLAIGIVLLWTVRQRYDAPGRHASGPEVEAHAPDGLRPAAAGAVASNGRVSFVHAMAALFELADRGALIIEEEPRKLLSSRSYVIERRRSGIAALGGHEQALLDAAFTNKGAVETRVTLAKARQRMASRLKDFRRVLLTELTAAGLVDPDRARAYERMGRVSLAVLLIGLALFGVAAALVQEYRAWPLVIPSAVILVSLVGFTMQGAMTPLSNEGVRRRDRWQAYQRHLKQVARHEIQLTADSPARVLPLAIALGLASAWSKFVKAHPEGAPPWFQAVSAGERDDAFAAFIAHGGAVAGSGGGAGAGGAAGGGGSGAS